MENMKINLAGFSYIGAAFFKSAKSIWDNSLSKIDHFEDLAEHHFRELPHFFNNGPIKKNMSHCMKPMSKSHSRSFISFMGYFSTCPNLWKCWIFWYDIFDLKAATAEGTCNASKMRSWSGGKSRERCCNGGGDGDTIIARHLRKKTAAAHQRNGEGLEYNQRNGEGLESPDAFLEVGRKFDANLWKCGRGTVIELCRRKTISMTMTMFSFFLHSRDVPRYIYICIHNINGMNMWIYM